MAEREGVAGSGDAKKSREEVTLSLSGITLRNDSMSKGPFLRRRRPGGLSIVYVSRDQRIPFTVRFQIDSFSEGCSL